MDNIVILLLNVMYFHGSWENQFPENKTAPSRFYLRSTTHLEVPFMTQTNRFLLHKSSSLEAKILKMPYLVNMTPR
jgi:serine protease inhibitor